MWSKGYKGLSVREGLAVLKNINLTLPILEAIIFFSIAYFLFPIHFHI